MCVAICCLCGNDTSRFCEFDDIEAHVRARLNGQVRDFRLLLRDHGLVLQGHSHTYYAKQLAQHTVMAATDLPILANDIADHAVFDRNQASAIAGAFFNMKTL
jgi:hypothetical protein